MFNVLHLIMIALYFASLAVLLKLSGGLTAEKIRKLLRGIAVFVTGLEIVKITSRIRQGYGPDSWVPLYYCSLFLFAIWLALSGNQVLARTGYAYMTMGGILASAFFMFYPSTSLGMYPFFHPSSIHSFVYHLIMSYCGILILWKQIYIPWSRDALYYFVFVFAACVPAAVLNEKIGTNCMFLRHPYGLPILQPILEASKPVYMLIVCIGQAVCMFWLHYGLYALAGRRRSAKEAACPV